MPSYTSARVDGNERYELAALTLLLIVVASMRFQKKLD